MANYLLTKRIQKILQYIKAKPYAPKQQVLDYLLTYDIEVSDRTFQRDLKSLRRDFGIEITYSKIYNGYYINEEESIDIVTFFKFLEMITLTEVFSDGLQDYKKLRDFVQFEDTPRLVGFDNLEPIAKAIKLDLKLSFAHYNYYKDISRSYTISPLILKEYLDRWYVVGILDGTEELLIFGIDRLSDIVLEGLMTINKKQFQKKLDKFSDIVGVRVNDSKIERIVLKTHEGNMRYFKSLPLHHSQAIIPDKEIGYYQISYYVIPNYEFDIEILKRSMDVEVIAPKSYRNHIKTEIEKIYQKYQE